MMGSAGRLLAALVALAGLLWPAVVFGVSTDDTGVDDPATITDYQASLVFGADGTLEAVERVTTDMPSGRPG